MVLDFINLTNKDSEVALHIIVWQMQISMVILINFVTPVVNVNNNVNNISLLEYQYFTQFVSVCVMNVLCLK